MALIYNIKKNHVYVSVITQHKNMIVNIINKRKIINKVL